MLADGLDFVLGVDTHRDVHAVGVIEVRSGVVVFEAAIAADSDPHVGLWRDLSRPLMCCRHQPRICQAQSATSSVTTNGTRT